MSKIITSFLDCPCCMSLAYEEWNNRFGCTLNGFKAAVGQPTTNSNQRIDRKVVYLPQIATNLKGAKALGVSHGCVSHN